MTADSQHRVADVYGLARVDRERRWTAIVDGALLLVIALWVGVLALSEGMSAAHWVVSVVLVAMVAHRVMILVERLRRRSRT
jgi:membrane protein YdbS with pleckstrin-like domain